MTDEAQDTRSLGRRLLDGWLEIAGRFSQVQTTVLMFLIYTVVIGPFAVGLSLVRHDPLGKRGYGSTGSAWQDSDTTMPDVERAKHSF